MFFGDCTLDDGCSVLRRAGVPVQVEPKVFEVLPYLIRHRDRFVSRDELITQLWPHPVITDTAVNRCVAEARKALGDDGTRQQIIRTQYIRGYRGIAPDQRASEGHEEGAVSRTGSNEPLPAEPGSLSPLPILQDDHDERAHASSPAVERSVVPRHPAPHRWTKVARTVLGIALLGRTLLSVRLVSIPWPWLSPLPEQMVAALQAKLTSKTDAQRWRMQITDHVEAREYTARGSVSN